MRLKSVYCILVDSINVTTKDNVVTLAGSTDSLASSKKAEEIARGVSDVKHVNNQLVIN
jgi:osmotically-inducible protein OsmY